ncbi:MAG: MBL fold metallo-hydrolase [Bacteroidetes bacterium]|nr:MBL fold metallo-hydrolase [Bacteroidota bacterium]
MHLTLLPTGTFKLDGGAMFGIVPKRLWQKANPADENNLCTWALRCLLIETGDRKILVDCSIGNKQEVKWRSFFEPTGAVSPLPALAERGISPEEITDVFLTHLHFDHCGGGVRSDENGKLVPTFPNATYWSNEQQWASAMNPNEKEKASFLKENFVPLREAGRVQFIDVQRNMLEWLPGLQVQYVHGHTDAMMMLHIDTAHGRFVYCADAMPSSFHLNLPWVMAYDIRPLVTLEEKASLLENAVEYEWRLIFEHDPSAACATLTKSETGRVVVKEKFTDALPGF